MADTLLFKAPATVNATTASAIVVAANDQRKYLCITNLTSEAVFLGVGNAAVADSGIVLVAAGSSLEMLHGQNLSREAIYAIHAGSGNKALAIQEA